MNKRLRLNSMLATLLSAACTFGALLPGGVEAKEMRLGSGFISIPDSTDFLLSTVNTLNVHIERGPDTRAGAANVTVGAKACVKFWNALGGECGTPSTAVLTPAGGFVTLTPGRTAWQRTLDFAYLELSGITAAAQIRHAGTYLRN